MFLAFILISALLSPVIRIPAVRCEEVHGYLSSFGNGNQLAYQDVIFAPFATPTPTVQLFQVGYPDLVVPSVKDVASSSKQFTRKNAKSSGKSRRGSGSDSSFNTRSTSSLLSLVKNRPKDYGQSSRFGTKGDRNSKDSTKKNFYLSLVEKLLKPTRKKEYSSGSSSNSNSKYIKSSIQHTPDSVMAADGGWGWKGGGGHGGISLFDLLLLKLSLLSLAGFLLNLLMNLLSLFGFGMMTSTATYPVTTTATYPATGATAATANTGAVLDYATGWPSASPSMSATGMGTGTTARTTVGSIVGKHDLGWGHQEHHDKGWGWNHHKHHDTGWGWNRARIKAHIKLPSGWPSTTTTTTTTTTEDPLLPPITLPTLTGALGEADDLDYITSFAEARKRKGRPKRETFKPYVDPITSLDIFARAVLNSVGSARNQYECIEKIHCENNKQARVVGQWLEYFMPLYSFGISLVGHRMGAGHSLLDHLRAIVLGATETNCRAHFPPCGPKVVK